MVVIVRSWCVRGFELVSHAALIGVRDITVGVLKNSCMSWNVKSVPDCLATVLVADLLGLALGGLTVCESFNCRSFLHRMHDLINKVGGIGA